MGRDEYFIPANVSSEDSSINIIPVVYSEGCISVNDLLLKIFRERLVLHFNIAFKEKLIVWPWHSKKSIIN